MAAWSSMRLVVVATSPPLSSFLCPPNSSTAPQPPGPGFPPHPPSAGMATRLNCSADPHRALFVEFQHVARLESGRGFGVGDLFVAKLDAALLHEPPRIPARFRRLETSRVTGDHYRHDVTFRGGQRERRQVRMGQ